MKTLTTTLALILFMLSNVMAQVGEIKGIVKDKETGEPIWNASVYIEVGGTIIGDATDFDGKYTISPVATGKYTVITKMAGYAPIKTKAVAVSSEKITYVNVDMSQTAEQLPDFELVVHVIPLISKDEPSIQHVQSKELKRTVYRGNPIAVATSLPGVTLAPNGKDVYIRGARPISTQFITDGIKSITGDIGIPGLAFGAMKVYTGGVPARYGDVTGGVIVVETKSYFDLAQQFK